MSDIKPELIEKLAGALRSVQLGDYLPEPLTPTSDEALDLAHAALEAVADDLRAEGAAKALRGAAESLEGATPRHLGESDLDYLDYDTDVEYGIDRAAEYLRSRADRIEARER